MIHVTYRLTAKNRDQLRNPTLGNRVWATFTFLASLIKVGRQSQWDNTVLAVIAMLPPVRASAAPGSHGDMTQR